MIKKIGKALFTVLVMLTLYYCIIIFLMEKSANSLMTLLLAMSGVIYHSLIVSDGGHIRYMPLFKIGKRKRGEILFTIKPWHILYLFVPAVVVGAYNFISL